MIHVKAIKDNDHKSLKLIASNSTCVKSYKMKFYHYWVSLNISVDHPVNDSCQWQAVSYTYWQLSDASNENILFLFYSHNLLILLSLSTVMFGESIVVWHDNFFSTVEWRTNSQYL